MIPPHGEPWAARPTNGLPVVRGLVRGRLGRLFGSRPFDADADRGDPGLTGPGSASWRVIAEPAAIGGGIRALLLQVAHPYAMAGVHDHSAFRDDPLGRLHRTSAYVSTTTFGSTREALEVTARVRAVHPHVRGVAPDGRPYRADDPRLLAWVGVALTSSFLEAHRRWAPRALTASEGDAFVAEQSRIAALLDPRVDLRPLRADADARIALRAGAYPLPMLDDGTLPATLDQLADVLASYGELGVNTQGREALRFLRRPPLPAGVAPAYRVLLRGAIGSLQPREGAALELDVSAGAARRWVASAGLLLTGMRVSSGTSPSERIARQRAGTSEVDARPAG